MVSEGSQIPSEGYKMVSKLSQKSSRKNRVQNGFRPFWTPLKPFVALLRPSKAPLRPSRTLLDHLTAYLDHRGALELKSSTPSVEGVGERGRVWEGVGEMLVWALNSNSL